MNAPPAYGLRQAAIVLAALGEDLAAAACSRLPANQVLRLGEEIAALGWVSAEELQSALQSFTDDEQAATRLGGSRYARRLLDAALGMSHAGQLASAELEELTIFSRLNELPVAALSNLLGTERRQVVATVVSHLSPLRASQLLSHYPETVAADIAYRAAHLGAPAPGAMQALALGLDVELRTANVQADNTPEVSLQYVVDLINALPAAKSKAVLEALGRLDRGFGEQVAEQVFTFEDIISLSDSNLQVLLRHVDMNLLVVALKGTPEELRERVRTNLSQRGRERLVEEMQMLGPVALSQVQEAQRQICAEARVLAENGEISLESGSEEYVE